MKERKRSKAEKVKTTERERSGTERRKTERASDRMWAGHCVRNCFKAKLEPKNALIGYSDKIGIKKTRRH